MADDNADDPDLEDFRKIPTGITGLDKLLHGGIPTENLILVSGPPGTGKSTLGAQYLLNGAEEDEPGVFVALGEEREKVVRNMKLHGWDIDPLREDNLLQILTPPIYNYDALVKAIRQAVEQMGAKRIVLDSLTIMESYFEDDFEVRRKVLDLKRMFDKLGATALTTSESPEDAYSHQRVGIEEYIVDGVIELYYLRDETAFKRAVAVRKMRGGSHSMEIHPLTIEKGGMAVHADAELEARDG